MTKYRGGTIIVVGRHGGVGLNLVRTLVQDRTLKYLAIQLVNRQIMLILSQPLTCDKELSLLGIEVSEKP